MTQPQVTEAYIVVDVEASGPSPGQHALLSIGACTLGEPRQTFYVELQPDREAWTAEAMAVSGLSLERLRAEGTPPAEAMQWFADWLAQVVPAGARPVFAAWNAPFDWMFVSEYFYRYLGRNPLGHAALDLKVYYMGLHGVSWEGTSYGQASRRYLDQRELEHHALADALNAAEILEAMFAEQKERTQ
ncbi:MAG: 3'-5' exonuclease [Anaerolineae bacterium]